ncbi:MAG: hypothetical protein ACYDHG_12250 [Desulfomonilaceae bacterium]
MCFWILGLLLGGILTYTTRHFINGDAIAYLDMAQAFRTGLWKESVFLGYSPGYSLLLAIFESIFQTTPDNELYMVKLFNFIVFIAAMITCDLFVSRLTDETDTEVERTPLPSYISKAMCYSAFLVASLIWVRVQLVTPDMIIFVFVLLSVVAVLNIKRSPDDVWNFVLLGVTTGFGYICKTFLFPFSVFFFAFAGMYCSSIRKALPRLILSASVMLVVSSPVIISQSLEVGRFSIGEVGVYNYTFYVAGQGSGIHVPKVIHHNPEVYYYDHGATSTYPQGDPAYWALGIAPVFNFRAQLSAIRSSLDQLASGTLWPTLVVLLWFVAQFKVATFVPLRMFPPSTFLMLIFMCFCGTAIYCLVSMEMRYVAAFLFLGFTALTTAPRYKQSDFVKHPSIIMEAAFVVAIFLGMVGIFVVDQSLRSLRSTDSKASHHETFMEMVATKDFLKANGMDKGDKVAVFRPINSKLYWARMSGVRVMGEIMSVNKFLDGTAQERRETLNALRDYGFKAVFVKEPRFSGIVNEGWKEIPGTRENYVYFLHKLRLSIQSHLPDENLARMLNRVN